MNDSALNEEQKKLVEENHNLIYQFANTKKLDLEEYYGVLAIGLCKAALSFDSAMGLKFSTLAYKCMQNELAQSLRMDNRCGHIPSDLILSLDLEYEDTDGETLYDFIPDRKQLENSAEKQTILKDFANRMLNDDEKELLRLRLEQQRTDLICKKFGFSRTILYKRLEAIKRKWLVYHGKG